MGWAAVHGECHWPAVLPLYFSGFCWTLLCAAAPKPEPPELPDRPTARRAEPPSRRAPPSPSRYDTIYAHQDKADDARAGVRSTALALGDDESALRWFALFGAGTLGLLAVAGAAAELPAPYYAGLAASGTHLAWQVRTVDLGSRADCLAKFKSNGLFGALVFAAIVAGRAMQEPPTQRAKRPELHGDSEAEARRE